MTAPVLSLTQAQMFQALGNFLTAILPAPAEVVRGQVNRVPEVSAADFVVMTPIGRRCLRTNVDEYADAVFTGAISGNTLIITAVQYGALDVGRAVFGVGIAAGTVITALGTGTGGIGTYAVNNAQTVTSEKIAAGVETLLQAVEWTVQLDVHGPSSADNAHIITTMFRDDAGVGLFAASGFDVTPLFCNDERQLPFGNEDQQMEDRWSIDAVMQVNPVLTIPQQFADALALGLVDVDVVYPPT